MKKYIAIVCVTVCLLLGQLITSAQEKAPQGPTLTQDQKQAIQIHLLQMENARLRFTSYLQTLQKEGYDLNLDTLEYVKKEVKK